MPSTFQSMGSWSLAASLRRAIDFFYIPPLSRIFSRELFRYAACGGTNMLLDALFYFLIYHYIIALRYIDLGFVVVSPHIASLVLVFPITFFNGFWLNRNVAFKESTLCTTTQLFRYMISVVGAIVLNYICMKLFVEGFGFWATPSKLLTTAISSIYSFLAAKFYTFR